MRYQVGQQVLAQFVNFTKMGPDTDMRFSANPFPWVDRIDAIKLAILEVVSHKKVPWDQDPEGDCKHDGYVLKLVASNFGVPASLIFFNQYPKASYGQVSTDADATFSIGALSPERVDQPLEEGEFEKFLDLEETLSGRRPFFWRMRDAEDVIQSLDRALDQLEKDEPECSMSRIHMLKVYRHQLHLAYITEAGFTLSQRNLAEGSEREYMVAELGRTNPEIVFSMTAQELATKVQAELEKRRVEVEA